MNQILKISNLYYLRLRQNEKNSKTIEAWPFLFIASLLCFLFFLSEFFSNTKNPEHNSLITGILMLATEASTLVILMVAKELNNKKNLNYLSKKYSRNFSTKTEAKIFLINKLTKSKQKNYHTIAIKIKNILDERNSKYYIGKQKKFDISKKIYDPESKQRIYSLSLVLIAPLFALCINYGANIETIFELFNHDQKTTLIIIWLIPSFLLWLGALLLITLMEVISTTFQATKFMTKKHKAKSDLSMLVFYSDLIELSRPL